MKIFLGVGNIVSRVVGLAGTGGLDIFGWYASPYLVGRYFCVLKHQCTGGNNGSLAHLTAVEERTAHADEGTVMDGAGVDGDVMAYGDVAADVCGASVVGDVDARAVLDVGAVANGDGGNVAAYNGIEPNRTFVAHGDIADDGCVLAEITVLAPLGCQTFV